MDNRLLYLTFANAEQAQLIGRTLVEERLVACVNLLGPIQSLYWWNNAVQDDREVAMVAKTRADLVDAVVVRVRELHSYACPCVVSLPIEAGNPAFLQWIQDETRKGG